MNFSTELKRYAKAHKRQLVAMTFYTEDGTRCEMTGSVPIEYGNELIRIWKHIQVLADKKSKDEEDEI